MEMISEIMLFLRTVKGRASLRRHTSLSPVLSNATRWSSAHAMVKRYFEISSAISVVVPPDLQLSPTQHSIASQLLSVLSNLEILTSNFQDESLQLCTVREYFDVAVNAFPALRRYCTAESHIIPHKEFESAVCKIQRSQQYGELLELSQNEQTAVAHLVKDIPPTNVEVSNHHTSDEDSSYDLQADLRLVKKRKSIQPNAGDKYLDLRFIRPTSNICERQFSISGFALTKHRKGLLPVNLEMQLFLHANALHWDESLFHNHRE
jgi:hypothetical protein